MHSNVEIIKTTAVIPSAETDKLELAGIVKKTIGDTK